MKIQWHKVTWYSVLMAVIVFIMTFLVGFYLGKVAGLAEAELYAGSYTRSPGMMHSGNYGMRNQSARNTAWGQTASSTDAVINTVTFSCSEGKSIHAVFKQNSVDLSLSDGRTMTLPHAISADGARYANADESFVFWNKGNGAFITEGSTTTYTNCTTQ